MTEARIVHVENLPKLQKALRLWLLALTLLPLIAVLLILGCILAHDAIAYALPGHTLLVEFIAITGIAVASVLGRRECKKRSGALYKAAEVLPVLSQKYQTQNYCNSGDFQENLRYAVIEGNIWTKAVVNDYFDGIDISNHAFECFDVRLKFNAVVMHGNIFKGHIVIFTMPWRLKGAPVDILHKTIKKEGHQQIRHLSALKNAGFALRFEVSYTDQDVLDSIKDDTNYIQQIQLKFALKASERRTVKLPTPDATDASTKPEKPIEEIITDALAQKLIDLENQTDELVSIHIQEDKVYISMASFCDILEPQLWDIFRSPDAVQQRVYQEIASIDAMIQLMEGL